MPRVYLDQDALIRLGRRNPDGDVAEVRRRIEARELTLVLSTAHWLDTAGGNSDENSRQLARFIDLLGPRWLKERLNLFHLEIHDFLHGIPFESTWEHAVLSTVTETVAEIAGTVGGGAAIVDTEAIVMELRHNPRALEVFANTYATTERNAEANRRAYRQRRITLEIEQRVQALAFQRFAHVAPGSDEERRLREAPTEAFRALSCEWEATREYWRQSAGMTPNRLRDLFHLAVALPYTDVILTYDEQLRLTMNEVAGRVGFHVSRVVTNMAELLAIH